MIQVEQANVAVTHCFVEHLDKCLDGRVRSRLSLGSGIRKAGRICTRANRAGLPGARFLRGWLTILCIAVCSRTLIAYPRQRGYCVFVSAPDGSPLLGPLAS